MQTVESGHQDRQLRKRRIGEWIVKYRGRSLQLKLYCWHKLKVCIMHQCSGAARHGADTEK